MRRDGRPACLLCRHTLGRGWTAQPPACSATAGVEEGPRAGGAAPAPADLVAGGAATTTGPPGSGKGFLCRRRGRAAATRLRRRRRALRIPDLGERRADQIWPPQRQPSASVPHPTQRRGRWRRGVGCARVAEVAGEELANLEAAHPGVSSLTSAWTRPPSLRSSRRRRCRRGHHRRPWSLLAAARSTASRDRDPLSRASSQAAVAPRRGAQHR